MSPFIFSEFIFVQGGGVAEGEITDRIIVQVRYKYCCGGEVREWTGTRWIWCGLPQPSSLTTAEGGIRSGINQARYRVRGTAFANC